MKTALLSAAAALAISFWASPSEALSCRDRLVRVGDSGARVLELCGDPVEVAQQQVARSRSVQRVLPDGTVVVETVTVTVLLETWTYDFGPQRFMRRLTFEEGRLIAIETLGYGSAGHSPP